MGSAVTFDCALAWLQYIYMRDPAVLAKRDKLAPCGKKHVTHCIATPLLLLSSAGPAGVCCRPLLPGAGGVAHQWAAGGPLR